MLKIQSLVRSLLIGLCFVNFTLSAQNALSFVGTDYVNLGSSINAAIAGTNQLTVEAWVYRTSNSNNFHTVVGNYSAGQMQFLLRIDFDKAVFWSSNDGGSTLFNAIGTTSIPLNNWTHVAGVYNGSTLKVFVNGVEEASSAMSGNYAPLATNTVIGFNPGAPANEGMQGNIDEIRIWNTARTVTQIQLNRFQILAGTESGLLAYYGFNQGSPGGNNAGVTTLTDATSNYNGTLTNFALTGATSNWVTGTTFSAAMAFDGVNDQVVCPDIDLTSFSLEAWVKTSTTGNYTILSKGNGNGTGDENFIFQIQNGKIALYMYQGATASWAYSTTTIPNNTWCHVALSYDDATRTNKFYLNGLLDGTSIRTNASPNQSNSSTYIGRQGSACNCNFFNGSMDEVRIWNTVRSCDEISQQRNCELTGSESGLRAYYKFNQGFAASANTGITQVLDATSNASNGTITNMTLTGASSNFISPGGVVNGTACGTVTFPEINLQGNSVSISSGDVTPSTADHTDFGNVDIASGAFTRTFTIQNTGISSLTLSGSPRVSVTGTGFSLQTDAASSVAASGSTTFVVAFDPSSNGLASGTISIANNDCDENPYTFSIQGTGVNPAAALNFDGTNDFVAISNTTITANSDFTWEAWIKTTGSGTIFAKAPVSGNGVVGTKALYVNASGKLVFDAYGVDDIVSPNSVNDGSFHHVALSADMDYSGGTDKFKLYIDGLLAIEKDFAFDANVDSEVGKINKVGFAADNFPLVPSYFNGTIDEVRIWNKVLLGCEIVTCMNFEKPAGTSGLVLNYHFNQGNDAANNGSVTALVDSSGSGINGTLTNMTLNGSSSNWIKPGGVISNVFCGLATYPEINILGNSTSISSGDVTPSTTDHTDFGNVDITSGSISRTFTIQNTGNNLLNLSGSPRVTLTGSGFTLQTDASATIAAAGSATFVVIFDPSIVGLASGTISIANNDCDENPYTFSIQGTGVTPGAALDFDGIDDYVAVASSPSIPVGNSSYTIEAKIKPTAFGDFGIIGWGNYGTLNQVNAFRLHSGSGTIVNYWWGADLFVDPSPINLIDGNWHHVAATYDGTTRKIYIDGILKGQDVPGVALAVPNASNFRIGSTCPLCGGELFSGSLDEVRVWNRALCLNEITNNINCEIPTTSSGLVANYHFNQGAAPVDNTGITSLTDASGNGNTGTLTNMQLNGSTSNWIAPGAVTSGVGCTVFSDSEINLQGNSVSISSGDVTPSTADHTDFGNVDIASGAFTRTFTIQNTGTALLNLTGSPRVTVSGTGFSLQTDASATVAASGSTTFVVAFDPSSAGLATGTISIANNDCDENAYNFSIQGTGTIAAAALNFDGGDDHVIVAHSPLLNTGNQITMEAWVYLETYKVQTILAKWDDDADQRGYMFNMGEFGDPTKLCLLFDQAGDWVTNHIRWNSNVTIPLGSWHHVAVTHDALLANNNIKVYLDGVLSAQTDWAYPIYGTSANLFLGANDIFGNGLNGGAGDRFLDGMLDEVRIWNRALCVGEIQNNMTCEIPTNASGLMANYHFNHGASGAANAGVNSLSDASGNNLNGVLNNFALASSSSNWIAPGGVVTGSSCSPFAAPEIVVSGNATAISSGDISPSLLDHTDFGSIDIASGAITRTFTIQNTGTAVLNLSGSPKVTVSGTGFTLQTDAAATVAVSGSTTFVVSFDPASAGVASGTITIANDDCNENPYTFSIQGTGTAVGAALNFDGVNDYVSIPYAAPLTLNSAAFSIEYWARPEIINAPDFQWVISKDNGNGNLDYLVGLATNNKWRFIARNLAIDISSTTSAVVGTYHHIACTFDGTTAKLYINGVLENSTTSIGSAVANTSNVMIGGRTASTPQQFFRGHIDEVRLWNKALCLSEITGYRTCEIPTSLSGLVANYHFNQGLGAGDNSAISTLTDASGNNYTGTLTNFTKSGSSSNFVALGGVTSGNNCTATFPEINLQGNSVSILTGDLTPSATDHSDFGSTAVNGAFVRTFTIQNTGTGVLNISSIVSSGTDAAQFVVGGVPATVAASGSATFTVTFTPVSTGLKAATITVNSNDCDEAAYTFSIQGTGVVFPNALKFDGVNDFVGAGTSMSSVFGGVDKKFTLEAWINGANFASATSWNIIMAKVSGSVCGQNGREFIWGVTPTGQLQFLFYGSLTGTSYATVTTTSTMSINSWNHVAAVYDGAIDTDPLDRVTLYINGVAQACTNTGSAGSLPFDIQVGPAHLGLGANLSNSGTFCGTANQYWDGSMDEVRIWDKARSCSEIKSTMNVGLLGTESNLVSYYNFNQGNPGATNTGLTTLLDIAGTADNGTLSGFALSGATSNWVDASSNGVSGTTPAPQAEIDVTGNSVSIVSSDATPSLTDSTDFGSIAVAAFNTNTFTIQNAGTALLTLSSSPRVTISGSSDFTLQTDASASVTASSNTTFKIKFTPSSVGLKTATITIQNDDCDEAAYTFTVQGTGATPAATLSFDGADDFVNLGTSLSGSFNSGNTITVESWFYPTSLSTWNTIIGDYDAGGPSKFLLRLDNSKVAFWLKGTQVLFSTTTLTTNQWYHAAGTWDGTTMKLYLNGVLEASVALSGNFDATPHNATIGRSSNWANEFFAGNIDEVRVWNRALDICEINNNRSCEIATTSAGLVANYHFNNGAASSTNTGITLLADATGNGYNGTLTNLTLTGAASNWIAPGAVTSGVSCSAFTAPEINLQGNSISILSGDVTPSTTDHTDFGTVDISSGAFTRTFTIQNTGNAVLNLSGTPRVTVTGTGFSLQTDAPATIAASNSATFVVAFDPSSLGLSIGTISIANNDCDENPYTFSIQGNGSNVASALNFDGVNDYLAISNTTISGNSDFTWEAWIKTTGSGTIFAKAPVSGNGTFGAKSFYVRADGKLCFDAYGVDDIISPGAVNDGNYHHVAVTADMDYSGGIDQFKLYVDGIMVIQKDFLFDANADNESSHINKVGFTNDNFPIVPSYFSGTIDEVRVWNKILNACEISTCMNYEKPKATAGLLLNYHFNQGISNSDNSGVTALIDSSGTGINGVLTNMTLNGAASNWVSSGAVVSNSFCTASPVAPTVTGTTPASRCGTGSVTLFATASSGTLNWYDAATAGTLVNTGTSFTTPSLSSTTTYYVEALVGSCISARTSVVATINPNPDFGVNPASDSVCTGSSITLKAGPNLIGYWKFDEGSGTTSADETGKGNPVTFFGAAGWQPSSAFSGSGNCLQLTTGDYAEASLAASLAAPGTNVSFETWVRPEFASIADGAGFIYADNYLFGMNWPQAGGGNKMNLWLVLNGAGYVLFEGPAIPLNTWSHLAATYDGSFVKLYMNGVEVASYAETRSLQSSSGTTIKIGQGNGGSGQNFIGKMDEVRVWSETRSLAQIQASMNSAVSGIGLNYTWSPSGTLSASTGATVVASPTANTTYTATGTDGNGCSVSKTAFVKVNTVPTITSTTPASRCGTGTVNLAATSSIGTVKWYDAASAGTLLSTGSNYTTPSISASTTYYAEANNNGCISAARSVVIAGVNDQVIQLLGNGNTIVNNDNTPTAIDNTDYGTVNIGSPLVRTFTIQNAGNSALNLTGTPRVAITGSTDFTVSTQPSAATIAGSGSLTFDVRYNPSSVATVTATITILSNDCSNGTFSFAVSGTGGNITVIVGDKNGNGTIDFPTEIAGDINENGVIDSPTEIAGDINGNGIIDGSEKAGDVTGDFTITLPLEISGNTNGSVNGSNTATISGTELVGDINGDGVISAPEIAGDANANGVIDYPSEFAGNKDGSVDGSGNATYNGTELVGDINGNGVIDVPGEISGDANGNGTIDYPSEFAGNKDGSVDGSGNATMNGTEKYGDINGNGLIDWPSEIAGDVNGNGNIEYPFEIAGNVNGSLNPTSDTATIVSPEFAGDLDGDGILDSNEKLGDVSGNGIINGNEISGDVNGTEVIDYPEEIAGNTNGSLNAPKDSATIRAPEITGDKNGNNIIDGSEIAGDINGDGVIQGSEKAGDINGDTLINYPAEIAGDINGGGAISQGEITGNVNGINGINSPELWGDANGDGFLSPAEIAALHAVPYYIYGVTPITTERVERYRVSPDTLTNMKYKWTYSSPTLDIITIDTLKYIDVFATTDAISGVFTCYLEKEGFPFDTLTFDLIINITKTADVGEVVNVTESCLAQEASNQCNGVYIDYFKINNLISDTTGCMPGGMQDFTKTDLIADLEMGGKYSAVIKPSDLYVNLFNDTLPLYYAIWIDYNNDGAFDGPNEFITQSDSKSKTVELFNIAIANEKAYAGQRRLRVGMRSSGGFTSSDACNPKGFGENSEREDYLVNIIPLNDLAGPNLISPNGDGKNDFFVVKGLDPLHVNKTRVKVFSTEGKIVYDSGDGNDYANDWGGTNEKGDKLSRGVYYYIITQGEGDQFKELKNFLDIQY